MKPSDRDNLLVSIDKRLTEVHVDVKKVLQETIPAIEKKQERHETNINWLRVGVVGLFVSFGGLALWALTR